MDYTLYLVTDASLSRNRTHTQVVEAAIRGGVTAVQYREKSANTRQMIDEARALRQLCRAAGVPFIVNDRIDVALAVDADGVHVGQDDMPVAMARRLIGNSRILGVSAGNVDEARRAEEQGANYIGASPIFATATKPDAPPAIGVEGLRKMTRVVSIPVVAIGGMNVENVSSVIAAGASGVAVVSAIVGAEDVEAAARSIRAAAQSAMQEKKRQS